MLQGKTILLRALEPEDSTFLYEIENDTTLWEYSHTQTPYSKYILQNYLENSHQDIYTAKQVRLSMVIKASNELIGFIDLFDFDPKNHRAGVGIAILKKEHQNKGYANETLGLLLSYCKKYLQLHQLYANIEATNIASKKLFISYGFQKIGTKKDWNFSNGKYSDEEMYQLLL